MNDLLNNLVNDLVNHLVNDRVNDSVNDLVNDIVNGLIYDLVNDLLNNVVNDLVNNPTNDLMNYFIIDYKPQSSLNCYLHCGHSSSLMYLSMSYDTIFGTCLLPFKTEIHVEILIYIT